jgi:hypothetical protein
MSMKSGRTVEGSKAEVPPKETGRKRKEEEKRQKVNQTMKVAELTPKVNIKHKAHQAPQQQGNWRVLDPCL